MRISVIVPTLNRSRSVGRTVSSFIAADYPPESYEVLVVDNGSTDGTRDVVERLAASHPRTAIRCLCEPTPGSTAARHRGAMEASGDILAFVDDDIEADKEWLIAIEQAFHADSVHLVGGRTKLRCEVSLPDWIRFFTHSCDLIPKARICGYLGLLDLGDCAFEVNPLYVWSENLAIRRRTLLDLGGFNPDYVPAYPRLQGDGETGLSYKVISNDLHALYEPKALVLHHVPQGRMTVQYFERRAYYQGVADSYTRIRAHGHADSRPLSVKDAVRGVKNATVQFLRGDTAEPNDRIRERVSKAHRAGYDFHQSEVRRDPRLLAWVLRKDYWNCAFPGLDSTEWAARR